MLGFWILIFLIVLLVFAGPWWPYSGTWGYAPAGVLVALLVVWLFVIWLGWIAFLPPWGGVAPTAGVPPPPPAPG